MLRFLLLYLVVYGGVNAYLLRNLRRAFALGVVGTLFLAFALALLVASPILVRVFQRAELVLLARPTAVVGYCWMAAAFWLFLLFAAADLWNLAVGTASRVAPAAAGLALPRLPTALFCFGLVAAAAAWGVREAGALRLRELTVATPHLPPGSRPIRVVFFSDVHLDLLGGEGTLRKLVELVDGAKPDLLLCGGDLVDAPREHRGASLELLRRLEAPLGKYAVTGNHEYYAGIREAERYIRDADFQLLKGASVLVGGRLLVVGVDDPAGRALGTQRTPEEDEVLPAESGRPPVLLLKHRPSVDGRSLGRFDLQLSGHSHHGQIFPFRYLTRLAYPLPEGLSEHGRGSFLYKGPGTGTWGPPFRVLAPPEVTLVTLKPARP